jgi:hypothetical protein
MSRVRSAMETHPPFGNQHAGNNKLKKRARLLQSHYRENVLHLPCGVGPNGTSKKEYGSMLRDRDKHGKNFLSAEISEYAQFRCRDKRKEETIDEYRLFNNMLSSQPMCFNLFALLRTAVRKGEDFVSKVFQKTLPQVKIGRVIRIEIEYIPIPIEEYINDKTAFDAFVEYRTKDGKKGCIGIETKYVDKLGSNSPADMGTKLWIAKEAGCFTQEGLARIRRKCPQIVRNFLLAEKYRLNSGYDESISLIISPEEDRGSFREVQSIQGVLQPQFHYKIQRKTLQEFVQAIRDHCPQHRRKWIEEFYRRYLDFESVK